MKELKQGLVLQGLLMLLLALFGLLKKNKFIPQKQALLYGMLGFASMAASAYVSKDVKLQLKKK